MVAGTFNAYETIDGVTSLSAAATVNGAAGSISLLFIAFAVVFGLIQKKAQFHGWKQTLLGLVCTVAAFVIGMNCPLITTKANWSYMVFAYIFLAAVLPMWLLMEPRDLMTTFMFAGMIIGAVVGLLVAHPAMNLAPYTGFHNEKSGDLFPILFVTVACGAYPVSTAWFPRVLPPRQSPMKRICRKLASALCFWKVYWLSWLCALPVLPLPLMARLQPVLRLLSSPPVLPDSWRCSESQFTLPSAL